MESANPVGPVRSAQTVVDVLSAQGVQYVFGVPGAKIDAVYDALVHDGPQGAPQPVSYTHLDVYKRQDLIWPV